jgi:transposase
MNKVKKFVGVDVSKDTLDFYSLIEGHAQMSNDKSGFKKALKKYGKDCVYVLEATGSYHHVLALYLYEHGTAVCVVNPLSVKRFIQMRLCRNKTDKSDAKMLLQYGESEDPKLWQPAAAYVEMSKHIQGVVSKYFRERTSLKNKLHSLTSKGCKTGEVIRSLKRSIKRLTEEIAKLEKELERVVKENEPELLSNLQSIPGVGRKTALLLISGTDGFRRFGSANQVISYLGLAPMEYSSGTSVRKQSRISKTGNPQIRNHLFLCAFTACQSNQQCKALYERIVAKGKSKKLALVAVCNKLVKQSFAIAKSGLPYDPQYKSIAPEK